MQFRNNLNSFFSSRLSPRVIKKCYESLQLLTSEISEESIGTIECLGQTLAVWQCEWRGLKDDFYEHFIRSHNNIEVFQQLQVSSVPFLSDQLLSAMTLVRAFDSNFIFYYHSCPAKKMIYFLIFRLDIDVDDRAKPETLIYELMVKSPTEENHCKVINYTERRWFIDFFSSFFSFSRPQTPNSTFSQAKIRWEMLPARRWHFPDTRRGALRRNHISIDTEAFVSRSHPFLVSN